MKALKILDSCGSVTVEGEVQPHHRVVVFHRSGETEDVFIADLAMVANVDQIKSSSASRSKRTPKYIQLLRFEEKLGATAVFRGAKVFYRLGEV